jgi:hypothetical protein
MMTMMIPSNQTIYNSWRSGEGPREDQLVGLVAQVLKVPRAQLCPNGRWDPGEFRAVCSYKRITVPQLRQLLLAAFESETKKDNANEKE